VNPPVLIIQAVINGATKGIVNSIYCLPDATTVNKFNILTFSDLTPSTEYQIAYHVLGR